MKECTIIFNTKNGYCLTPCKCKSISDALRKARETKLAYRIFVNGILYKHGWFY